MKLPIDTTTDTVPMMVPSAMMPLLLDAESRGTLDFHNLPIQKYGRGIFGRDCVILIDHQEVGRGQIRWSDDRPWYKRVWMFVTRQRVSAPDPRIDFGKFVQFD